METLFDLTGQYKELVALSESSDPEEEELFNDTLEGLKGEIGAKLDDYALVMDQIAAKKEMYERYIEAAKQKADTCKRHLDRMKEAAYEAVKSVQPDKKGKKHIDGEFRKFSIVNNGGKQPMVIDGDVPESYQKIIYDIDKDKIRAALEKGEKLVFAHLEPRGTHLSIK